MFSYFEQIFPAEKAVREGYKVQMASEAKK